MKKIAFLLLIIFCFPLSAQSFLVCLNNGTFDSLNISPDMIFYFSDPNAEITQLIEPANAAMNVASEALFKWRAIEGKIYDFLISDDVNFDDSLEYVEALDTNLYRLKNSLDNNKKYYWKVRLHGYELWTLPRFFTTYSPPMPKKILSWALQNSSSAIEISCNYDDEIDSLMVLLSDDGQSFKDTVFCDSRDMSLPNLLEHHYYMKITGVNTSGCGPLSDMLFVTSAYSHEPALIINGFNRQTAGNTGDLILRHAQALSEFENAIVSATNGAMLEGLLNFPNYSLIDYMLGEESTVDETFSTSEQEIIKTYLRAGGNLLVSGSEIAWDLDNKGSPSDKAFCHDFLHVEYFQDSPGGRAGSTYSVEATGDSIFLNLGVFNFDNGSHGSYNVRYPDVFKVRGDAQRCLKYPGYSGAAGVVYQGQFPSGTAPGKVMVLGFPFETVYPEQKRIELMGSFVKLAHHGLPIWESMLPDKHQLLANYPNPFNPITTIAYRLREKCQLQLFIYDINGKKLALLADNEQRAGSYELRWDASHFASGIYFAFMKVNDQFIGSQKMTLLK